MNSTFDNFVVREGAKDALDAAKLLSSGVTDWKLLLIYGTWGNGKTHLLEATSLALWNRGISSRVLTFPDFVSQLKGTFDKSQDNKDASFNDLMDSVCKRPYLLLDDVGSAGSFTPWSLSQLERIMLARYRDNLFTMITTNVDYSSLPNFVVSRFSDVEKGRIVFNGASDFRAEKKLPIDN